MEYKLNINYRTVCKMLSKYEEYLKEEGLKVNTIKSYKRHMQGYIQWHTETKGMELTKLYRTNILDYKSYLLNIKQQKASTINAKISALIKFNEYLQEEGIQEDIVVSKKDNVKVQASGVSPTDVSKQEVEQFRQCILEGEGIKIYAMVNLMAYGSLRVSECINLRPRDINTVSRELIVRDGKGEKQRVVYLNDKIINSLNEYARSFEWKNSEYVFPSRQSKMFNRTRINQIFKKYSNKITPHTLRHFYCTNALEEGGFSVHEVAHQAGHSNINTTMRYTNPTIEKMKEKANRL